MKRRRKSYEDVNYWKSMSDALIALLLVILLFALLFALKLFTSGDSLAGLVGESIAQEITKQETQKDEVSGDEGDNLGGKKGPGGKGGIGGAGGVGGYQTIVYEPEYKSGALSTAAVRIIAKDKETQNPIREAGIIFELFMDNVQQTLSIYYPEKEQFMDFTTSKDGELYLPEAIPIGSYYVKNVAEPRGYDLADDVEFTIDEGRKWSNAYEVSVLFTPSRNTLRVSATDKDTGLPIEGAEFKVITAEPIVTLDDTIRYQKDEEVCTIVCKEDGLGESEELYLGDYILIPQTIEGYAKSAPIRVSVEKKQNENLAIQNVELEKTTMIIYLSDAYYTEIALEGAEFELSDDRGNIKSYKTDEQGKIIITDLKADTLYHLYETKIPSDYKADNTDYTFAVDASGYIDNSTQSQLLITNKKIRAVFNLADMVTRRKISGINIKLSDIYGNEIREWTSSESEEEISGIEAGEYILEIKGRTDKTINISIDDSPQMQKYTVGIMTELDMALAAAFVAIVLFILIIFLRRIYTRKYKGK